MVPGAMANVMLTIYIIYIYITHGKQRILNDDE